MIEKQPGQRRRDQVVGRTFCAAGGNPRLVLFPLGNIIPSWFTKSGIRAMAGAGFRAKSSMYEL